MDRSALQTLGFGSLPDEASLRTRYRELLFANHPDRRSTDLANQRTGQIIQAYRTVQQAIRGNQNGPARRAEPPQMTRSGMCFQLLRGAFGNIAVPLDAVEGFVRASDTTIANEFFHAIARHRGQSYVLFSPAGRHVSSRAPVRWLLLLSTRERSALAFRTPPDTNFVIPATDTLLLRASGRAGAVVVGGLTFDIPAIPGIGS